MGVETLALILVDIAEASARAARDALLAHQLRSSDPSGADESLVRVQIALDHELKLSLDEANRITTELLGSNPPKRAG
jgi:hypothetical protein